MNKKVLGIAVVLLVVAMLATPVFGTAQACGFGRSRRAAPPTRGTFSQGLVEVTVTPGESFTTGDVQHNRGATGATYLYGAPWGNSLPDSGSTTITMRINTVTWTGRRILMSHETYAAGTVVGIAIAEILGFGSYTYMGPTFSFDLPGISGTVTQGDTFLGLLVEGFGVKHGVSGDLKGLQTKETFTGVSILVGPLTGVSLLDNTATYKLPG
jgi:hypothetical protein